jgi:hypothetical protein
MWLHTTVVKDSDFLQCCAGVMKAVPFSALNRLLPWAIGGFVINSVTGMLFFIAAADQ